jgi:putative nucleotidyltransferase with HDIG domain
MTLVDAMSTTGSADVGTMLAQKIAQRRLDLPVLPMVATQVLSLCQNDATDAARLSAAIHGDPALAAHVLRVANSVAYAGSVSCSSLQQAVSRLGQQLVADLAVAVAIKGRVFASDGCADVFAQLWRHSVLTGFFAKEIARVRRRNVEVAFLCGLLHDVGKAVLLANVDGERGRVALDDLAAALQQHHTQVGVDLARGWRLPEPIVESIACHHEWSQAGSFRDAAMTVCLADLLAHFASTAPSSPAPVSAAPMSPGPASVDALQQHPVLLGLNLYPDQLQALLQKADAGLAVVQSLA